MYNQTDEIIRNLTTVGIEDGVVKILFPVPYEVGRKDRDWRRRSDSKMKVGTDGVLYQPIYRVDNLTVTVWIKLNDDNINVNMSTSEGY